MKKYEIVEQWLVDHFNKGSIAPGEKLPSEKEICDELDVSRNVVRQALNNLRIKDLIHSVDKVGSFRSENKPGDDQSTKNIGLITFSIESYIFPRIIKACSRTLNPKGYHILHGDTEYFIDLEREHLKQFKEKKIDGLIIEPIYSPGESSNVDYLKALEDQGIPVVILDSPIKDYRFNTVTLDDYGTGRKAASYLWDMGHRDIGIFYKNDYLPKIERMKGARDFLENKGIMLVGTRLISTSTRNDKGVFQDYGLLSRTLNPSDLPTAFFCTSDEDSICLRRVLLEKGIQVPQDVSIIGHDNCNIPGNELESLTTFAYPGEHIGRKAAEIILEKLESRDFRTHTNIVIEPEFIERGSVLALGIM